MAFDRDKRGAQVAQEMENRGRDGTKQFRAERRHSPSRQGDGSGLAPSTPSARSQSATVTLARWRMTPFGSKLFCSIPSSVFHFLSHLRASLVPVERHVNLPLTRTRA